MRLTLGIPVLLLTVVADASSQVRASEAGSVSQTVDGTVITLEYSRPVARGRDPLFGGIVEWNEMWTPGANWATTLRVDRGVRVNGEALPEGDYSVWMVPREGGPWDVVFHDDARRFHTQRPDSASAGEVLRLHVGPEAGEHMETLTWYFPVVTRDGATLRMHWGRTVVPLRVTVEPSKTVNPGWYQDGQLHDVDADVAFVFDVAGGRADGFELWGRGQLMGRAGRD